ncbi:Rho GTPase activation protein [Zopfochytrium polystomum]|nr:Rho GTPase activation protein [Zopfochytrium polystomum]
MRRSDRNYVNPASGFGSDESLSSQPFSKPNIFSAFGSSNSLTSSTLSPPVNQQSTPQQPKTPQKSPSIPTPQPIPQPHYGADSIHVEFQENDGFEQLFAGDSYLISSNRAILGGSESQKPIKNRFWKQKNQHPVREPSPGPSMASTSSESTFYPGPAKSTSFPESSGNVSSSSISTSNSGRTFFGMGKSKESKDSKDTSKDFSNKTGDNGASGGDIATLMSGFEEEEGYIFGVPLEVAVARAGKNGVPDIVLGCIDHLEKSELVHEGLYRVPGSARRVKEWIEKFESAAMESWPDLSTASSDPKLSRIPPSTKGPVVSFDGESPSTVASLLKKFFIRVKGGLMGDGQIWRDLDVIFADPSIPRGAGGSPTSQLVLAVRNHLENFLPTPCHLRTVALYVCHLQRVSAAAETNKMTVQNLAIVAFPGGGLAAEMMIQWARELFFGWEAAGLAADGSGTVQIAPPRHQEKARTSSRQVQQMLSPPPSGGLSPVPISPPTSQPISQQLQPITNAPSIIHVPPPVKRSVPAWLTERPREFSEQTFAAAREYATHLAHMEALERAGHVPKGTVASAAMIDPLACLSLAELPSVVPPKTSNNAGTSIQLFERPVFVHEELLDVRSGVRRDADTESEPPHGKGAARDAGKEDSR